MQKTPKVGRVVQRYLMQRRAEALYECPRCHGKGQIPAHSNVLGGVCFKCGGSGKVKTKPVSKKPEWGVFFLSKRTGRRTLVYHEAGSLSETAVRRRIEERYPKTDAAFKAEYDLATLEVERLAPALLQALEVERGEHPQARAEQPPAPRHHKQQELIDQIRGLPEYERKTILQSFVDQLEQDRNLSPAQLAVLKKFVPAPPNTSDWRSLREELFDMFEAKVIAPTLSWLKQHEGAYQGDVYNHAVHTWHDQIADEWREFKVRPERRGRDLVNELVDDLGGWERSGVSGATDALACIDLLAKKGDKAPRTLLNMVSPIKAFEAWLRSLSPTKIEHTLATHHRWCGGFK